MLLTKPCLLLSRVQKGLCSNLGSIPNLSLWNQPSSRQTQLWGRWLIGVMGLCWGRNILIYWWLPRIDVSDIKFVVNFDFPNNTEDYVHRIGRTARAKNTGTAYTYFTTQNAKQAKELVEVLREANQNINPKLYEMMQLAKQIFHSKSKCVCVEVCMCGSVHAVCSES